MQLYYVTGAGVRYYTYTANEFERARLGRLLAAKGHPNPFTHEDGDFSTTQHPWFTLKLAKELHAAINKTKVTA